MSSPANVHAMVAARGEPVVIRRQTAVNPPVFSAAVVLAMVRQDGTRPTADIQQAGRWSVIVSAIALSAAGFPSAVEENDAVIIDPQVVGGAYVEGSGRVLRVTAPGRRGTAGFWMTAEG